MKKILAALMLCLVSFGFIGCEEKNAPINKDQSCIVNIETSSNSVVLNSLTIKDENGKLVSTGKYWGSYYVPYNGTLTVNWDHRFYSSDKWANSEYTFNVGYAHELNVSITSGVEISNVYIGGTCVASFKH